MQTLLHDLRYAIRMLVKKPGFTVVVVLTLALGIAANSAMFSVVQAVLLTPLPVREPERLVTFSLSAPAKKMKEVNFTPGFFDLAHERTQTLEKFAAYETGSTSLTGRGEPEQLDTAAVTADYFRVLGLEAQQGRTFLAGEDTPGKHHVAILSHELWQRRFNGDAAIVGQSINLDNQPTTVVGVMPPSTGFPNQAEQPGFPEHVDLWVSLAINPENRSYFNYLAVGRLKPGLSAADAQREMQTIWDDFIRQYDAQLGAGSLGPGSFIVMTPLTERIVGNIRLPLLVLLVGVVVVLLVTCANIANLLLSRAALRNREFALRRCLGAGRWRIARQLMTESLLLAMVGGVSGLLLANWGVEVLRQLLAGEIPLIESARLDPRTVLFTFSISLVTGVLFGLAPAFRGARMNLQETIKDGSHASASRSSRRLRDAFVVSQVALSLILLIGATLIVRSFKNLTSVDPGFQGENVLSATVSLPEAQYPDDVRVRAFFTQLLERAQHLPGVTSAGLCQIVPFSGGGGGYAFTVEGAQSAPGEPAKVSWRRSVTPDYFTTMSIPLLKGRAFEKTDTEASEPVAIVDEKLAREYWSGSDPIGKRLRIGGATSKAPWLTVVGVVRSVKNRQLDEDARFYIYQPFTQWAQRETSVVMRTSVDPESTTAGLRAQLAQLDPNLPLFEVTTVSGSVARSVKTKRLASFLLMGFASTALLLAVIGIYGVISLNVNSRTNEFGIRMALGAPPRSVLQLVVWQGMRVAAIGIAIGVLMALLLTRLLGGLLFGVTPTDPLTFTLVSGVLTGAALAAAYIPARRATKVDPLVALRYE